MREKAMMNAMRSGVVVMGALAFGYLTLQLGFKPFLERAQVSDEQAEPSSSPSTMEQPNSTSSHQL